MNDLEYMVSTHFMVLLDKIKQCQHLGNEAWSCYHSRTEVLRKRYIRKVNRLLSSRLPQFKGPWLSQKTTHGQSNPTYILKGNNNIKLVLRRKPDGKLLKSAHMVEREFEVMKALGGTEVPVPNVYYLCTDPSEIGSVYFVMDFIDGVTFPEPQLTGLTASQRRKVYDSMNAGLASLHRIDPCKVGLGKFGKEGNYFARQLSRWSRQFELSVTEHIAEMEVLREWLSKNVPINEIKPRLVHGDWRIDNLLFSKDRFSLLAIIDWELSTLGDPRADLAAQLMQWSLPVGSEGRGLAGIDREKLGIPSNEEYIEDYSRRVGLTRPIDLTFAIAFSYFRMGAILQGVKKRALEGNASNPEKGIKMGSYVQIIAKSALAYLKI